MWMKEENKYGMMDAAKCQTGLTPLTEVLADELDLCRYSMLKG